MKSDMTTAYTISRKHGDLQGIIGDAMPAPKTLKTMGDNTAGGCSHV